MAVQAEKPEHPINKNSVSATRRKGKRMITELVVFDLPKGITREELLEKYRQSVPTWSGNPDLLHKAYFFDAEKGEGGGVYLWKTEEAARRWHGEAFLERVRTVYGSEPRIRRLDTMIVVDNAGGQVAEPAPG